MEQPFYVELEKLGITELELDKQCDDLFQDIPIKFEVRKGNKMDEKINFYTQALNCKFPIVHI